MKALPVAAVLAAAVVLTADGGSDADGYLYAIYTDHENLDIVDVHESHTEGGKRTAMSQQYRSFIGPDGISSFWGFDGETGRGPFGAFYAAINLVDDCPAYDADDGAEGRMSESAGCVAYILDPGNLRETLAGHEFDTTLYNVMLVVPTVYWVSETVVADRTVGNLVEGTEYNVLYASSQPSYAPAGHAKVTGMVAYAHSASTVSGVADFESSVYPYLGIGVYESYATSEADIVSGAMVSQSGRVPASGPNVDGFKGLADALIPASGDGLESDYQQWNFYQWTLCKIMAYTVMGTKNAQVMVGAGYTGENDSPAVTGSTDAVGFIGNAASTVSASGRVSTEDGSVSSKLFIENFWGSMNTFLGDAYVAGDSADTMVLYAGNFLGGEPLIESRPQPSAGQPWADIFKGGDPHRVIASASAGSATWDTPTASNANAAAYSDPGFPGDIVNSSAGGTNSMTSGGRWDNGSYAGVAFICGAYPIDLANQYRGARLAYLMSEDALARYRKVIYAPEHGWSMSPVYEPMTFEELSELYRVEMKGGALSKTRPDLFKAMAELLNRLRDDYERELRKDPESLMCEGANSRRKKADTLVKEVISLRSMKISKMALRTVTGAGNALDALTPEEKDFYDRLSAIFAEHAATVDVLRGRRPYTDTRLDVEPAEEPAPAAVPEEPAVVTRHAPAPEEPKPAPEPAEIPEEEPVDDFEPFDDPADMPGDFPDDSDAVFMAGMQEAPKPVPEPTEDDMETMVLLRVLEDLPAFVGPERDYELSKEDVITMPKVMADALVRMEKAVVVRPAP